MWERISLDHAYIKYERGGTIRARDQLNEQASSSFRHMNTWDNGQNRSGKLEMRFRFGFCFGDYGKPQKQKTIFRLVGSGDRTWALPNASPVCYQRDLLFDLVWVNILTGWFLTATKRCPVCCEWIDVRSLAANSFVVKNNGLVARLTALYRLALL